MASWLPFLLLPLYFAGLAAAMYWLSPRTADDPALPAISPNNDEAPASPSITRRERPKHGAAPPQP